ncbi:MAG: ubiquinol-cytochrome c reductase iron-sulfur subunit [Gemmatimonadota bacterium]|nr:MAG: ubiquinol-cytochrome c reductase iron-sulfur subunit [Gemmatimonadota bacterium]
MSDRRPEVETKGPDSTVGASSRRSFLWKIWLGLGGLAVLEYIWLAADFLRPRGSGPADDAESIIIAGAVERFSPGSVTAFPTGKFYLARLENGGFLALSRECTHLGCTVPWIDDEARFVCPCHSSAYDMRGDVLNPPAPRALDNYAVRIENGIVKVDVSRPLKRRSFEYAQIVLP